jgi:hypothetical protein
MYCTKNGCSACLVNSLTLSFSRLAAATCLAEA